MIFSQSLFTAVVAVTSLALPASAAPTKRDLKFDFGNTKVRGVNLGGWLVLEPWITPSIFEATPDNVVDEYTFGQTLGQDEGGRRLQSHWNSWITEDDFTQIKSAGLNLVRIPVGYWSVSPRDGDPYIGGAYEYLKKAVGWANNHGLAVMIDLHGAPESQNGFDNSGKKGSVGWTQGDTVQQTLTALRKIRDDFASDPAVVAIELLNEPLGPALNMDTVRQFYMDGWGDLRDSNVGVVFHDAFEGVTSWNDWGSGMRNLVLDTHHYEIFDSNALQQGIDQHVSSACGFGNQMASNNKWTVSGEWTGAMTDCARWLNGRGVGARYDGTWNVNGQGSSYIGSCDGKYQGTVAGFGEADHNNIKRFIEAQLVAYEKAAGWIFWCWKNEAAPEWHFQNLTAAGLLPQPLDSLNRGVCG